MGTQLKPSQLYQRDPLLRLVRDRLQLGLAWPMLAVSLVATAVLVIGRRWAGNPIAGTNDLAMVLLQTLGIFPIGMLIYLRLPDELTGLLNSLKQNGVIGEKRPSTRMPYPAFEQRLIAQVDNRWWTWLAVGGVVLYWLYRLTADIPGDVTGLAREEARLWLRLAILIVYSPVLYGALLSAVKFLIGLLYTDRLFRSFQIHVNPLHPDGGGGLGAIGRMLVTSVLVATAVGATAAAMAITDRSLGRNPFLRAETWALATVYLVALPSLFVGWLWQPHSAMRTARAAALEPLADEFLDSVEKSVPSQERDAGAVKESTDRLAEIQRRYEFLMGTFPIWPIRIKALNRLVATSLLPLISSLASAVIPALSDAVINLFK